MRSVYDETDGRLLYEAGPWRIPENHTRVLGLFREHSIPLGPLRTPTLSKSEMPTPVPGLTVWDVNALRHGPSKADEMDLRTGYADQTHCASGSAPYTTTASRYCIAHDGFSALVSALQKEQDVRLGHRVVDVTCSDGDGTMVQGTNPYAVRVRRRLGHNSFEDITLYATKLVVCVPPGACRDWTIFAASARSVMNAVEEGELHHIYARRRVPSFRHYRSWKSLLGQSISSQYENEWFQASYSGGRVARLWHNLRLSDPDRFRRRLSEEVSRLWGRRVDVTNDHDVRCHFWETAFHHWRAVPGFDLAHAVRSAVRPSPHLLPNVYLAGEAFSSHQAWMEGALETAEMAREALLSDEEATLWRVVSRDGGGNDPSRLAVRVEGHVLDVTEWAKVHPGSEAALRNHNGEDVTDLMHHIGHSPHAWAVVHSLKSRSPSG